MIFLNANKSSVVYNFILFFKSLKSKLVQRLMELLHIQEKYAVPWNVVNVVGLNVMKDQEVKKRVVLNLFQKRKFVVSMVKKLPVASKVSKISESTLLTSSTKNPEVISVKF